MKRSFPFAWWLLLITLMIAFMTFLLRGNLFDRPADYPVETLDDGWEIIKNGNTLDISRLSDFRDTDVKRGDRFILRITFEHEKEIPSACLRYHSLSSYVSARMEGEEIFSFGEEYYLSRSLIPKPYCYILLPPSYPGKTLEIEITAAENGAFYAIGPVLYGNEQDLYLDYLTSRRVPLFCGLFLCVFGQMQLFWMPLLLHRNRKHWQIVFGSLLTLVMGVYMLAYYNLFDIFTDIAATNIRLEFFSLYLLPGLMSAFFATMLSGLPKRLYTGFTIFDLLLFVYVTLLNELSTTHLPKFLNVVYALTFIQSIPFLYSYFTGWGRRRRTYQDRMEEWSGRILTTGFMCYVAGTIIDVIRFVAPKLNTSLPPASSIPFMTLGSFIFSSALAVHYFLHGAAGLRAEATRQMLISKAYSDPLTGLYNRVQCEQVLESLGTEKTPYVLISIDMDGLKQVNDTMGHDAGDRMIAGFGEVLRECFSQARLTGRMGGDEFLVILTGTQGAKAQALCTQMQQMLDEKNKSQQEFHYSVSYGIATGTETELGRRTRDVYMLADKRMYEMKRGRYTGASDG